MRTFIVVLLSAFIGQAGMADPPTGGLSDIGTLGGFEGSADCSAINRNGDLAGTSGTPDGAGRAFLWTKQKGMVSLGTLGGYQSSASDLSDDGVVVGMSYTLDEQPHAFRWTSTSGMVDLTPEAPQSFANAVSGAGHVVGYAYDETGITSAFLWTSAGGLQSLGLFNGSATQAWDVNDAGEIAGSYATPEGPGSFYWSAATGYVDLGIETHVKMINRHGQICGHQGASGFERAFLWSLTSGFLDLGTLGGPVSAALALNNAGDVVGSATIDTGETRGFHWSSSTGMTGISTFGGFASMAEGISPDGDTVVGWATHPSTLAHAFRWTRTGGLVDLGTLSGGLSRAFRVNNSGKAFGTSFAGFQQRAVIWTPEGAIKDVGTLQGGMSEASAVSPAGHVAGSSMAAEGRLNAFVWTNAGGMVGVGDLGGGESRAVTVNASGHVAGNSLTADFKERGFYWSPNLPAMVDVGDHGGAQVTVAGMNASNTIVANLSYKEAETPNSKVLRWSPSGFQILEPLEGGDFPFGAAIDGQGRIVGACRLEGVLRAVAWAPGEIFPIILVSPDDLGGGIRAEATHVTETTGWVAGSIESTDLSSRSWIREPLGTLSLLEDLGAGLGSQIRGLGPNGDAVGFVRTADGYAVPAVWRAGEMTGSERKLTLIAGTTSPGAAVAVSALGKVAGALEEGGAFVWTAAGGLELLGTLGGMTTEFATIGEGGHVAGTSMTATGERRAFVWKRGTFP